MEKENKSLSDKIIHGNKIHYDVLNTNFWLKRMDVKEFIKELKEELEVINARQEVVDWIINKINKLAGPDLFLNRKVKVDLVIKALDHMEMSA